MNVRPVTVTVLGSGTSTGVPVPACSCTVCLSAAARNQRTRCSILISFDEYNVLVDTSTDLRQQVLRERITHIDAVLFTHTHADHVNGIDDLRPYNLVSGEAIPIYASGEDLATLRRVFAYWQRAPIPVYGSPATLEGVRKTFWYAFEDLPEGGGRPKLDLVPVGGPFELGGLRVVPLVGDHGSMGVTLFRIGPFAYATDCKRLPPETVEGLRGVDTLAINASQVGLLLLPCPPSSSSSSSSSGC